MRKAMQRFFRDESGATAIEYGLIAAGISIAIIAAVQGLGSSQHHLHERPDRAEVERGVARMRRHDLPPRSITSRSRKVPSGPSGDEVKRILIPWRRALCGLSRSHPRRTITAPHWTRRASIPIAPAAPPATTSRDFVPWRFSDAGPPRMPMVHHPGIRRTFLEHPPLAPPQ